MEPDLTQPITVCCSGNCPTILVRPDEVLITDDFDGSVQMTLEQFEKLYQTYQELKPSVVAQ